MPIKLPKGFPRRKSSGNALEEVTNPPQPSFRVFERPPGGSKSFDGGNSLKLTNQARPLSEGQYVDEISSRIGRPIPTPSTNNRGSGGTQKSSSSTGQYDTSSSSARYSSSSTLPSTSSIENHIDDYSHAHPKPLASLPKPPAPAAQPGFSIRAAGRAFSFGKRISHSAQAEEASGKSTTLIALPQPHSSYADIPDIPHVTRPRAMTETSASTATPPKFLDTDLDFGHSDDADGFGKMFDDFGADRSTISRSPDNLEVSDSQSSARPNSVLVANPYLANRSPFTPPPPLNTTERSRQGLASPYSTYSQSSQDGLMASSPKEDQGLFEDENIFRHPNRQSYQLLANRNSPVLQSPATQPRQDSPGMALRRNSAYNSYNAHRISTPSEDTDALLVMDSINASRAMNRQQSPYRDSLSQAANRPTHPQDVENVTGPSNGSPTTTQRLFRKPLSNAKSQPSTDSKPLQSSDVNRLNEDALLYDPSFREMANSTEQYQARKLSPPRNPPSKVMTPAQFEKYREECELLRSKSTSSKSDGSDNGDTYDDDDEQRNREVVKQRRKQEAHLSVYRQQMMKVTGEQPSKFLGTGDQRPGLGKVSFSAPNLSSRMSSASLSVDKPATSGKSSDDEDEDVPLGILAAHGFPSKEKAPSHLGAASNIRFTSEPYPPPPASVAGGSVAGGGVRGSLPPFARNLPKDPYYGASIVNPSNRETPAFGNSGAGSAYGGSPRNIHPGGLVGVIATEERERAMRRGSPNGGGGYGLPGSGLPLPPSMAPPGMLTLGDQAQIQMSQQMNQMMQMQMQWMQQMMAMQGVPPGQLPQMSPNPQMSGPPSMAPNGFLSPPGSQLQMQRPYSVGVQSAPNTPMMPQQQQQRTMSMLSPAMAGQWAQPGNRQSAAPSLMPSMMSGALAPAQGYTPSIAPSERSNVGQPSRYRPVSIAPVDEAPMKSSRASTMSSATALNGVKQTTVRAAKGAGSDDDDEQGWEEMRRQKEQKKGAWKGKKRDEGMGQGLGDLYYPGT
ncbi:hypothetical protein MMC13_006681 [Lambiella insularis]|nr:hypothetical protein [Lambiella insularis]